MEVYVGLIDQLCLVLVHLVNGVLVREGVCECKVSDRIFSIRKVVLKLQNELTRLVRVVEPVGHLLDETTPFALFVG